MVKKNALKNVFIPLLCCFITVLFSKTTAAEVNFDTAWTFVYDGGKDSASGKVYWDDFYDVKVLPNGVCVCVGSSAYTGSQSLVIKLDTSGKLLQKKLYVTSNATVNLNSQSAHSLFIAKNGDYLIGGERFRAPWVMRLDSLGNIKWSTWYYDSTKGFLGRIFSGSGYINSIRETSKGSIICAVGDEFPNNGGSALSNYAAYLEFDSLGNMSHWGEWSNEAGYKMGGFSIEESSENRYLLAGNQTVLSIDMAGTTKWKNKYTFSLDGVGTMVNNITRAKKLRDGTLMVTGQAYEGGCWTTYKKLYFDAWWSPITPGGSHITWDTAGRQGGDDYIYDFTQLNDGKLVFVGKKSSISALGGVWAFVTDSTGKNILWEKQTNIIYRTTDGRAPCPLSVCATPDSGFTVVGEYACSDLNGGMNAFAAHYIPKPVTNASKTNRPQLRKQSVNCAVSENKVIFTLPQNSQSPINLTICNAAGKVIANNKYRDAQNGKVIWDAAVMGKEIYFYKIAIDGRVSVGKIVVSGEL